MSGFPPFYETISDKDLNEISELLRAGMPRNSTIRSVIFVSDDAIFRAQRAGMAAQVKLESGDELTHRESLAFRWYKAVYQSWAKGRLRLSAKALKGEKGAQWMLERTSQNEFGRDNAPDEQPASPDATAVASAIGDAVAAALSRK